MVRPTQRGDPSLALSLVGRSYTWAEAVGMLGGAAAQNTAQSNLRHWTASVTGEREEEEEEEEEDSCHSRGGRIG